MNAILTSKWTKVAVFVLCLVPLGLLIWRAIQGDLTANPINYIEHRTGDWTLRFLVITLAVSPLRKILGCRSSSAFAGCWACSRSFTAASTSARGSASTLRSRPVRHRESHRQAPLHHGRLFRLLADDSARVHLDGRLDPAPRRKALAHAASPDLRQRDRRRDPFFWLVKSDKRKPLEYGLLVAILLAWRIGSWLIDRFRPAPATAAPPSRTRPESA